MTAEEVERLDAEERRVLAADMVANPIRYYRPRPTAKRFHLDIDHAVRMVSGGNRGGKSVMCVADSVMAGTGICSLFCKGATKKFPWEPPLNIRHWCTNISKVVEPTLLPIYYNLIPPDMIDRRRGESQPGYNKSTSTLYLTNGTTIQFISYYAPLVEADSVSLHCCVFDEPPPEHIYDSQYGRVGDTGGLIWGAMTMWERLCKHPIGWFDERIRRGEDGAHVAHYRVTMWENVDRIVATTKLTNPKLAQAINDRFHQWSDNLQKNDPGQYKARVLGLPGILEGLVYKEFQQSLHAQYDLATPEELVQRARNGKGIVWCGLDHGMRDPTAVPFIYINRETNDALKLAEGDWLVFREYKRAGLKVPAHIRALATITKGMPVEGYIGDPHMWDTDPRGGLSIAAHYIKGLADAKVCNRVVKGNNQKDVGHDLVGQLLAPPEPGKYPQWPRLRICKGRCPELIKEFLSYCWIPENERTGAGTDKTVDVNDHLMDALRYAACGRMSGKAVRQVPRAPRHRTTGVPADMLMSEHPLARARRMRRARGKNGIR